MKLEQKKFEALLTAPVVPKGMVLPNWAKSMKKAGDKIKKGIRNEMREFSDFLKETAQSKGITVEELLKEPVFAQLKERELERRQKTLETLTKKHPNGSTMFSRGVDDSRMKYERYRRAGFYPLYGSGKEKVKGLIFLGLMALTGDPRLKKYLKPGADKIITGEPVCICPPEKLKEFRLRLKSLLAEFGWIIIDSNFKPEMLKLGSEKLNRLVESYCLQGFAPHVDFIVVEIPDTPRNNRDSVATSPGRKLLALDIRVARK